MKTRHAILARRARLLGLLGLGIIALPGTASAMSGITLDAATNLAVNPFHLDSGAVLSSTAHGRPAGSDRRTRRTLGQDGDVDLDARGGKLLLSMDRTVPDRGEDSDQGSVQLASVTPASHPDLLASGSWPWAPKPRESVLQDPLPDASPPHATSQQVAPPGNQASPGRTTESHSDDAGVPKEISGDIERAAGPGWIALLPRHFRPHFMASDPVSARLPNPSVTSPFCVGLLGLRLAGQDEQLAGQGGTGCERSQSSPASNSIIYLRIRLL